jgi:hypothetical protein
MFATGVSGGIFGEFSGEAPIDVSDDIHFCYSSTSFCYAHSGEAPVVCPASSVYFFIL